MSALIRIGWKSHGGRRRPAAQHSAGRRNLSARAPRQPPPMTANFGDHAMSNEACRCHEPCPWVRVQLEPVRVQELPHSMIAQIPGKGVPGRARSGQPAVDFRSCRHPQGSARKFFDGRTVNLRRYDLCRLEMLLRRTNFPRMLDRPFNDLAAVTERLRPGMRLRLDSATFTRFFGHGPSALEVAATFAKRHECTCFVEVKQGEQSAEFTAAPSRRVAY
jgi:hypothetical protein